MADELVLSVSHDATQGEIIFKIKGPVPFGNVSSFDHYGGQQHSFAGIVSEVADFEDADPNNVDSTYRFPASDINFDSLSDDHMITFSLIYSSGKGKQRTKALTMSKGKAKELKKS